MPEYEVLGDSEEMGIVGLAFVTLRSLGRWMRSESVWWARGGRWAFAHGGVLAMILAAWTYVTCCRR